VKKRLLDALIAAAIGFLVALLGDMLEILNDVYNTVVSNVAGGGAASLAYLVRNIYY